MNGPPGAGSTVHGANFAGLVQNLLQRKGSPNDTASDGDSLDDIHPSRQLPSTGLKRNLKNHQHKEGPDGAANGHHVNGKPGHQHSATSSASSIPSDAEGEEDLRSPDTRAEEQEGAEGRGPGRHEGDLSALGNGDGGKPNGHHSAPVVNGHAPERDRDSGNYFDPVERIDEGASEGEDELGRRPGILHAIKDEEKPGPRNELNLEPRVTHLHVSREAWFLIFADGQFHQKLTYTGKGLERGPTLVIAPDGESEVPLTPHVHDAPGPSTPQHPHHAHQHRVHSGSLSAHSVHRHDTPHAHVDTPGRMSDGTWRSAVGGHDTPGPSRPTPRRHLNRFSSFRSPTHAHASTTDDSEPDTNTQPETNHRAQRRWSMVRQRILPHARKANALQATVAVPITTELLAGQLPVMILKSWLDRDEDGNRAVPVLLGNMRFRVGDSVGLRPGTQNDREMFKLECEYGDGAVKWVIYRELRDFLSLHAHYKAANFGTSVAGFRTSRRVEIPEFPKMSEWAAGSHSMV